jgi:hypothetical protein
MSSTYEIIQNELEKDREKEKIRRELIEARVKEERNQDIEDAKKQIDLQLESWEKYLKKELGYRMTIKLEVDFLDTVEHVDNYLKSEKHGFPQGSVDYSNNEKGDKKNYKGEIRIRL